MLGSTHTEDKGKRLDNVSESRYTIQEKRVEKEQKKAMRRSLKRDQERRGDQYGVVYCCSIPFKNMYSKILNFSVRKRLLT